MSKEELIDTLFERYKSETESSVFATNAFQKWLKAELLEHLQRVPSEEIEEIMFKWVSEALSTRVYTDDAFGSIRYQADFTNLTEAFIAGANYSARYVPKDGWISVKDRLPEHGIEVNVVGVFGFVTTARFDKIKNEWYAYNALGRLCIYNIIFWRYLPSPPKK